MELTYRDVVNASSAPPGKISATAELLALAPGPIAEVSAMISRNLRHLDGVLKDFNAALEKTREEYRDDDGNIDEERRGEFEKEIDELLSQVVTVDIIVITMELLYKCEEVRKGFGMPPSIMYGAWFLFEEIK